jgi:hypothetical protein
MESTGRSGAFASWPSTARNFLLPDTDEVRQEFGVIAYSIGKTGELQGERPYALASVMYDVLNRVPVDARLGRADAYEVELIQAPENTYNLPALRV